MSNNNAGGLGEAVEALRQELKLSYAQMGVRAGLDGSTIFKIVKTNRASMETVVQLARAFHQDLDAWLALGGFPTLERREPAPDPQQAAAEEANRAIQLIIRGFNELKREHPTLDLPFPVAEEEVPTLTEERARERLAALRQRIARGEIRARPKVDLARVGFAREESPRQRYEGGRAALEAKYGGRGYALPQGTAHASGGDFATDEDADAALLVWLEWLAELNPGRAKPEELGEG